MSLIDDLYRQNEWATLRLLETCRTLTPEQLEASAEGTYGSIRRTLLHIVGGEPSYITRIGGRYEGPAIRYEPFPGFDALAEATRHAADGFIDRAQAALDQSWTFTTPEGETIDAEVVLVQALNHAAEHRAQICTILTTLGLEPPALDGWTWAVETGRVRMR
ncbi:MAG: hypothetical protein M0R73_06455 [Dehalococcoidia bacterium]|nr:hypothetical protein [Dehalococcoidia bacterium]